MLWYHVLAVVIPVLGLLLIIVKNLKWKRIIENSQMILQELQVSLEDGNITKAEFLKIVEKVIDAFL